MENAISGVAVANFAAVRAHSRAVNYRQRAAQLRSMAETEDMGQMRERLLTLAEQYDGIAARID